MRNISILRILSTALFAAAVFSILASSPSFAGPVRTSDSGNIVIIENSSSGMRIDIDKTSGVYHVSKDGKRFAGDGLVAVRVNGRMLLNAEPGGTLSGDMKLTGVKTSSGADKTGDYESATIGWDTAGLRFDTEFRIYSQTAAIKFLQIFPEGYKTTEKAAFGDTSLNFPVFAADDSGADMNVFAYNYQIWPQAQFGKNVKRTVSNWSNGFIATPLFIFDKSGWTGVLAPFSDFLIHFVRALDLKAQGFGGAIAVGLDGELLKLEPGHVTQSILVFSNTGVVDSMDKLGAALLAESGKKPLDKNGTFFLKYLGYWTDNGAYYYYRTEPGKNYADTLLAFGDYVKKENIPVRHVQLDSWWYYKSKVDNGVMRWEPQTDMFPEGLAAFQKKLGLPLTFHNRYFAIDTSYKDKMAFIGNDGVKIGEADKNAEFGNGPSSKNGLQPLTREVFDIWGQSVRDWGGVMYEQDWLGTQISRVEALRSDPALAGNWMKNMNAAMQDRGLDIQYCMSRPRS